MITFKQLLEALTPDQVKKYKRTKMTPEARSSTDHFFGKDNDRVEEPVRQSNPDKSEVHRKVERHLGHEISPEDYKAGIIKDKYGRSVKIGKLIKDKALQSEFASDNTRAGKRLKGLTISSHRGTEVAGQTNPEADHSWAQESCKNIKDGCNNHFLKPEIQHGTVVNFVHDHNGKEIYRSTLQPYMNEKGHRVYHLDSEYGIKHPDFTAHSYDIARRLSHPEVSTDVYQIHPDVYNNKDRNIALHPAATVEHISKALNDEDSNVRLAAIQHPAATVEHISKALDDKDSNVRENAIQHPNATPEHIDKALKDKNPDVRFFAIQHPNVTARHIDKALDDEDHCVRASAIRHPNVTARHIDKALNDKDSNVRENAIEHPNATSEHISKALDDKDRYVRISAIQHPKVTVENISKALDDEDRYVRISAIQHPKATPEHISKALNDTDYVVRKAAIQHLNVTREHIKKALFDKNMDVRVAAATAARSLTKSTDKGFPIPKLDEN